MHVIDINKLKGSDYDDIQMYVNDIHNMLTTDLRKTGP